jgi:hypothetical protein
VIPDSVGLCLALGRRDDERTTRVRCIAETNEGAGRREMGERCTSWLVTAAGLLKELALE